MAGRLWIAVTVAIVALGASILPSLLNPFDASDLQGKRVVLTGGSKGIGRDIALYYCQHGAEVTLAARGKPGLMKVAQRCKELGGKAHVVAGDLGSQAHVQVLVDQAVQEMGGIDVLILNHVVGYWDNWLLGNASDMEETLQHYFRINTFGYIYAATLALPHLEASHGRLCVVSSGAGIIGMPRVAPYSATKHALHGFFNSLRHELAERASNVSLTTAVLGSIDTESARVNTHGAIDHLPKHTSLDTATAIVKATTQGRRDLYYPFAELYFVYVFSTLFPSTIERVLRYAITLN